MNAPELLPLVDIQSQIDTRNLPIQAVGIKEVRYPVRLRAPQAAQGQRHTIDTVGHWTMSVGLAASVKGTHMSRFIELLEAPRDALDLDGFSIYLTLAVLFIAQATNTPLSFGHLLVILGILLGVFVRATYTFSADFPLNDGGLFYQMAVDLQRNHYVLPASTPYNFDEIPFAYPPLGFYLAALLDDLTPLSMMDVFRFLPLAVTGLTVLAMYRLAKDVLQSKTAVVVAVFAFALVPRSFIWLLMGGGITRSLGLLFAMLALHQIYLMYHTRERRYVITSSVLTLVVVPVIYGYLDDLGAWVRKRLGWGPSLPASGPRQSDH